MRIPILWGKINWDWTDRLYPPAVEGGYAAANNIEEDTKVSKFDKVFGQNSTQ